MSKFVTATHRLALVVCLLGALSLSTSAFAQRGALFLDKTGFATAADDDTLDLASEAMTVEAWIKHDGTSNADAVILTKSSGGTIDYELSFAGQGEEVPVRFYFYGTSYYAESTVGVPAKVWTHVAGTWDGSTLSVYVNGQLSGTTQSSGPSNATTTPLIVGAGTPTGGRYFSGEIDEIRIWEAVRSEEDIQNALFAGLTGTEAGLAVYYPFNGDGQDAVGANDLGLQGSALIAAPGIFPAAPHLYATTSGTSATLRWDERLGANGANEATQFKLYRMTNPGASDRQLVATIAAGTTSYTDTGLASGTTYYYQVTSVDAAGLESDYSYRLAATPYLTRGGGALDLTSGGYAIGSARPSVALASESMTVEAWIKHDGTSDADAVILTKRDGNTIDYELSLAGAGEEVPVRFYFYGSTYFAESSVGIPAHVWTHVAGTWDGTTLAVYVNGELSGSSVSSGPSNATTTPLVIGAGSTTGGRTFSGLIDEVRIWNIVRFEHDIEASRLDQLEGREEGLRAYYRFDEIGAAPVGYHVGGPGTLELEDNAQVVPGGVFPLPPQAFARPAKGYAVIAWAPRDEDDTAGYRIYRSAEADRSDRQLFKALPASVTTYPDTEISTDGTYYYDVTTLNEAGQESDYATTAPLALHPQRDGNALSLAGTGYATVDNRPALTLASESMTVEAWIKHDGTSDADAVILTKRDGNTIDYELSLAGAGEEVPVRFYFYGSTYFAESSVNILAHVWTHVAGTWDGTTLAVYINGELSGSSVSSGPSNGTTTPLLIGAESSTGGRFFKGLIDEVRIWGIVRAPHELSRDMTETLLGDEEGLRAYFRFDEREGGIAYGATTASMTAELQGDATFSAAGTPVAVEGEAGLPETFTLDGNYPNPFNPSTSIRFGLPSASAVHVTVYDGLGRQVAQLLKGDILQGGWHEVIFEASRLPSGVYVYRVEATNLARVGRMILLK